MNLKKNLPNTGDDKEHRSATNTAHGYGSQNHEALEKKSNLPNTGDDKGHRDATHTTHKYGS